MWIPGAPHMTDGPRPLSVSTTSCFSVLKLSSYQQPHRTESVLKAVMFPVAVKPYRAEYFTPALTQHVIPNSDTHVHGMHRHTKRLHTVSNIR